MKDQNAKPRSFARRAIGTLLLLAGLLALVTPLTPGAWLALIGAEMLGIRLVFWDRFKAWFGEKRLERAEADREAGK